MTKTFSDYAVLIHRLYDAGRAKKGGLDLLLDHLLRLGKTITYFEFPLKIETYPYVVVTKKSENHSEELLKIKLLSQNNIIRRLHELFLLLYLPLKLKIFYIPCITADPLTSVPLCLLKKIKLTKYIYYHCVDYSETRFTNVFLNALYKLLLRFTISSADLTGCVTMRIYEILKSKQLGNLFYIPNSPSMADYLKYRKLNTQRTKNNLVVTCSGLSNKYRIVDTIHLFKKITVTIPDATLTLIGSTVFDPSAFNQIMETIDNSGVSSKIKVTGYLSKEANLLEVSKAWIGLAFYDKSYSHVNYGDSLKIREYAALGIPIVSDLTTPTSVEMKERNAGIAVDEPWDAYEPLVELMTNPNLYEKMEAAALQWAEEVNKDKIVETLVNNYLTCNGKNY